jgi:hypothetical protein
MTGERETSPSRLLVSIGTEKGGGGLFVLNVSYEQIRVEFMWSTMFSINKSDIRAIRKHDSYLCGYWLETDSPIWMDRKRLYVSEACILYQMPGYRQKMLRNILLSHGYSIDSYYDSLWM